MLTVDLIVLQYARLIFQIISENRTISLILYIAYFYAPVIWKEKRLQKYFIQFAHFYVLFPKLVTTSEWYYNSIIITVTVIYLIISRFSARYEGNYATNT